MLKIVITLAALAVAGSAAAQVHVRGYTRSDGTYVAPHTRSSPNSSTADNYGSYRSPSVRPAAPQSFYTPPATPRACEGYGCYGQPSATTGAPRTTTVQGYIRRDGTYVAPHVRSGPR